MLNATRTRPSLRQRLCRSLCREQGAKDAVMVAFLAVVLGALALQLASGPAGPRPTRRDDLHASLDLQAGSTPWPLRAGLEA